RRRSHSPLGAIDRFSDLLKLAVDLEIFSAGRVKDEWTPIDLKQRIIAPFVGVTDLDGKSGELFERLLFRRLVHPFECFDPIAQGFFQVIYQFQRTRFRFWREIIGDIKFAKSLAYGPVGRNNHAFPAWLDLFRPTKN